MLKDEMQRIMQGVNFYVLLLCVSNVLSREGFSDVQLLGRRTTKQKSYIGGCDLVAYQKLGIFETKTLVKVIQDDVRLRMLDEMTGTMPRAKANFGVIVTPFGSTKQVAELNTQYPGNPIRIIEGKELATLLIRHRLGVREYLGKLVPDYTYLQQLHEGSRRVLTFLKANREVR